MLSRITFAYLLSISFASAFGTIVLTLINELVQKGDYLEVIMYFFRGLILSVFLLPVLISLLIVASLNQEMQYEDLRIKLQNTHIFSAIMVFFLGNMLFYYVAPVPTDFLGLQIGISFVLIGLYALFSYFGWKVIFNNYNG